MTHYITIHATKQKVNETRPVKGVKSKKPQQHTHNFPATLYCNKKRKLSDHKKETHLHLEPFPVALTTVEAAEVEESTGRRTEAAETGMGAEAAPKVSL